LVKEESHVLSLQQQRRLELLAMLNQEQFDSEWFERDLGWGAYKWLYDAMVIEQGPLRDEYIEQVQAATKWDWTLLDERNTPEELERERQLEILLKQMDNKELTFSEAVQKMQEIDKNSQPGK
jgi:hypothetical protein